MIRRHQGASTSQCTGSSTRYRFCLDGPRTIPASREASVHSTPCKVFTTWAISAGYGMMSVCADMVIGRVAPLQAAARRHDVRAATRPTLRTKIRK